MAPDRSLEEMLSREAVSMLGEIGVKALLEPSERDHGDATMYTLDMDIAKEIVLRRFASVRSALSPVQGEELPELDFSCATTRMMAERDVAQYSDDLLKGIAIARTESLELRERQLRAAQAEIGRLKGEAEWKKSIQGLLFALGMKEEMKGSWGGNIEGWGAAFEWIKHHVNRSQSAELALSTCRAAALKECLEAVSTFSQTGIAEGDYERGYRRATEEIRQSILALPKAGK